MWFSFKKNAGFTNGGIFIGPKTQVAGDRRLIGVDPYTFRPYKTKSYNRTCARASVRAIWPLANLRRRSRTPIMVRVPAGATERDFCGDNARISQPQLAEENRSAAS